MKLLRAWISMMAMLASAGIDGARADEKNLWPLFTRHTPPGASHEVTQGLVTLLFRESHADGAVRQGFRPFFEEIRQADSDQVSGSLLYPLHHWETTAGGESRWSVLNLINHAQSREQVGGITRFDAWPFWFSRDTGDPDSSYRALFPLWGDVPQRFGQDRARWTLFPLYGRFEKSGTVTTTAPWPFLKIVTGDNHRGLELWPLLGAREHRGVSRDRFALWPLLYSHETNLDTSTPSIQAGILPFYAFDRSPGYRSETYLWPFFGYVNRTEPYQYQATNYFWPLFVQGRGDDRLVNRWAPFYSHSDIKGMEKTWLMWPLWREATWEEGMIRQQRQQLLYFVYHQTTQHSLTNPEAAPARKTHLWPLLSQWDNGAGRKQVQILSPFEVFLPHNERTRKLWSPLFALYRYNEVETGAHRHSLLWNAITYAEDPTTDQRSFHLGPLLGYETESGQREVTLLGGLIRFGQSAKGKAWRWNPRSEHEIVKTSPPSNL